MTFGGTNNNTAEQIQQNRVKTTDPPSPRDTVARKTFGQIMTTQLHTPEAGRSIPFRVLSTVKLSIFFFRNLERVSGFYSHLPVNFLGLIFLVGLRFLVRLRFLVALRFLGLSCR